MGKILCRRRSNKRTNPRQRGSDQQVSHGQKQSQKSENEPTEPKGDPHLPGGGKVRRVSTRPTPSSLDVSAVASDRSHVCAPALSHNTVENLTINNSIVIQNQPAVPEQTLQPQKQQALPESESYTKTVLRTPKKSKNCQKPKQQLKRKQLDFSQVGDEKNRKLKHRSVMGEIIMASASAAYHCDRCKAHVPQFTAETVIIKCHMCKCSWKCSKVRCTCEAEILVEPLNKQRHLITLKDNHLRSIVSFNDEGYCDTERIQRDVLQLGYLRVNYADGAVKNVITIQPIRI